jgi:hypothetical protein
LEQGQPTDTTEEKDKPATELDGRNKVTYEKQIAQNICMAPMGSTNGEGTPLNHGNKVGVNFTRVRIKYAYFLPVSGNKYAYIRLT